MVQEKKTRSWGHRLREENKALKGKIADLRKENARLKKDLEKAWELMAHIPGGIFLLQGETIAYANEAASSWLGYGSGDLSGKDLRHIVDPEELAPILEFIQGKAGIRTPDVLRFKNSEGKPLFCAVHIKKTRHEGRNALLLNLIEIDRNIEREKSRLEALKFEALRKLTGTLVRERENAFNAENPLFETLKTFSREYYHPSELSPLNLNEMIETSVAEYCSKNGIQYGKRSDFENRTVLISSLNTSSPINGSQEDLQLAFLSLVANAVEALEKPGEIYLTAQEDPGSINVYIQENGCGIGENTAHRIYDPFFSTKGNEHKGLGMSVARAIIERHGGKINMVNHEAGGTTFHVRLPMNFAPQTDNLSRKKSFANARILLVGDQNILINLLRHFLSSKQFDVHHIDRYDECLKILKKDPFDLLLLDHEKDPSHTAWLIHRVRDTRSNMPIALFNVPRPKDMGSLKTQKVDLIIPKPLHMEQFHTKIVRLMSESRLS